MFKTFKIRKKLQPQDKHYAKWFRQHEHLLPRLDTMIAHEVIILSDYTDEEIEKYGVSLLYHLTKDLALKPTYLKYLNTKSKKTLSDSVLEYQRKELGVAIHNFAYINQVVGKL